MTAYLITSGSGTVQAADGTAEPYSWSLTYDDVAGTIDWDATGSLGTPLIRNFSIADQQTGKTMTLTDQVAPLGKTSWNAGKYHVTLDANGLMTNPAINACEVDWMA